MDISHLNIENLSASEYNEIPFISVSGLNIYVKLSGNKLVDAKSTDVGSVFVGTSGRESYYFLSDQLSTERIIINLFKDRNKLIEMGKNAHSKATIHLSWKKYGDKIIDIYEKLLQDKLIINK